MIELALPWMLLLLPLPLLAARLLPPAPEGGPALRVPFFAALAASPGDAASGGWRRTLVASAKALAWVALVLAAAQPRWVGEPEARPTAGRDLMLAVDLSGSMRIPDFELHGEPVDRLSAVVAVAREFVRAREGDRLGLVVFGSRAYLQAPLTTDRETVAEFLGESEIGLAGDETAVGDAIGLAVKHLRERPDGQKVLVLLSDGASNAGELSPARAAELAREAGVRIYTIGVGSRDPVIETPFGPQRVQGAEPDEAALEALARETGGAYFRAEDTAGLARVYAQLDALEPTAGKAERVRPTRALFHWPLGAALAAVLALASAPLAPRWRPVEESPAC